MLPGLAVKTGNSGYTSVARVRTRADLLTNVVLSRVPSGYHWQLGGLMRMALPCLMALAVSVSPALAADQLTFGVEAGANINEITFSGSDATGLDSSVKAGLVVGGFISLPVAPMVAIQPEVVYTQKHSRLTGRQNVFTATAKIDFVEIPVLARFAFSATKTPRFYIVIGPGFSFTTKATQTNQKFGIQTFPDEDLKAENKVRNNDVSIIAGAGVMFGQLGIEGRYDGGLRNLNIANNTATLDMKERTATILFRWSFRKG